MEQPRFISLPILWIMSNDDEESEDYKLAELLGKEPETVKKMGSIMVNPQHIVAYNDARKENCLTLRLADGELYTIHLSIEKFEEKLHNFYHSSESKRIRSEFMADTIKRM